jgi:ABC-type transport system involved in multi-copper enzyme maturation permease subunit
MTDSTPTPDRSAALTRAELPPGRFGLLGVVRSEWTKMRTVRSTLWSLGVLVALGIGLSALATAETTSHWSQTSFIDQATFDPTRSSLIGIFFGQLVIGILGVLVVSAEYGTGTIRATFAAAPRRPLVVVAKVIVFGTVAFVVSEVVAFASYLLGQSLLTGATPHTTLADPNAFRAVFGAGCYLCLLGVFALAIATIVRHTAGAISTFVGVLLVLPIIVSALPNAFPNAINRYLPADIGHVVISRVHGAYEFGPWSGILVLAGYTVGLLAIGTVLLIRRDA